MTNAKNFKIYTLSAIFAAMMSANAYGFETKARNAILVDVQTGDYLMTKDHLTMIPTASMSKLMTVYLLFEAIKNGNISLEDTFTVSENAWKKGGAATGGSTMFLNIGDEVKVEDLIKGIIIQSGNDACIVTAENMAGSEESFAALMNEKAVELGLNNSHFENSTGLPHPDHRMSVEDLAKLAQKIINDFPEMYHVFSQKEFTYNGIKQWNRNPLLYSMPDADGLKTGHTEEAGFSLTASAKRGDRRLIAVMAGMDSNKDRSEEAEKLMSWGFHEFENHKVVSKGDVLAEIPVWYGKEENIKAVAADDIIKTIEKFKDKKVKTTIEYDKPLYAPIVKGQKIGVIKVSYKGDVSEYPLVAEKDVAKVGMFGKFIANIKHLLFGGK